MEPDAWGVNRNQNVAGDRWVGPEEVTLKGSVGGYEVKRGGCNLVSLIKGSLVLTGLIWGHIWKSVFIVINSEIKRQPKM